jgi:hypothetical protein
MWLERNGEKVTGKTKIVIPDRPEFYGVIAIQGTYRDGLFIFEETAVLENRPQPGARWCLKRGVLHVTEGPDGAQLSGNWSASGCAPGTVKVVRGHAICGDYRLVGEYDRRHDDYHHYGGKGNEIATPICKVGPRCSRAKIFDLMLTEARFIGPSDDRRPVTPCKMTRVNIGPSRDNYVRTTIDRPSFSITNYTVEDRHWLHPGKVVRTVVERGGAILVVTEGEGTGDLPAANEFFAPQVWRGVDEELNKAYSASIPTKSKGRSK